MLQRAYLLSRRVSLSQKVAVTRESLRRDHGFNVHRAIAVCILALTYHHGNHATAGDFVRKGSP